ncbi:MAG: hypothetical protein NC918_00770 [Candidatus Omnitrophica bacterium]|nr:hypothetical protein [Candidatus Omnitrophota bacterium]
MFFLEQNQEQIERQKMTHKEMIKELGITYHITSQKEDGTFVVEKNFTTSNLTNLLDKLIKKNDIENLYFLLCYLSDFYNSASGKVELPSTLFSVVEYKNNIKKAIESKAENFPQEIKKYFFQNGSFNFFSKKSNADWSLVDENFKDPAPYPLSQDKEQKVEKPDLAILVPVPNENANTKKSNRDSKKQDSFKNQKNTPKLIPDFRDLESTLKTINIIFSNYITNNGESSIYEIPSNTFFDRLKQILKIADKIDKKNFLLKFFLLYNLNIIELKNSTINDLINEINGLIDEIKPSKEDLEDRKKDLFVLFFFLSKKNKSLVIDSIYKLDKNTYGSDYINSLKNFFIHDTMNDDEIKQFLKDLELDNMFNLYK